MQATDDTVNDGFRFVTFDFGRADIASTSCPSNWHRRCGDDVQIMRKTALILAVTIAVPNGSTYGQPGTGPNAFSDLVQICDAYRELDVVFLGRAQAPITFRISEAAEVEIEKARQEFINVEREVTRLRASLDPPTRLERELEFASRLAEANVEFTSRQAMYSNFDYDLTLFPVIVEQTLRGPTEATLMLRLP